MRTSESQLKNLADAISGEYKRLGIVPEYANFSFYYPSETYGRYGYLNWDWRGEDGYLEGKQVRLPYTRRGCYDVILGMLQVTRNF